jgi:tetratricopeptide (TPR) repeat protein
MGILTRAVRLTTKIYTEDDKKLAWDKAMHAKELLAKAFYEHHNKPLVLKAFTLYEESLALYPEFAETYLGIAYISFISGNVKTAVAFLYNALALEPRNSDALNMLNSFGKGNEQQGLSFKVPQAPVQAKVMASKQFLESIKNADFW